MKLLANTMGASCHLGGSEEGGWDLNFGNGWSRLLGLPTKRCRLTRVAGTRPTPLKVARLRPAGEADRVWGLEVLGGGAWTAAAGGMLVA